MKRRSKLVGRVGKIVSYEFINLSFGRKTLGSPTGGSKFEKFAHLTLSLVKTELKQKIFA
jgi:hypothetical protein